MKENIITLLMQTLDTAYCDSCNHNLNDDYCEYCHRKNINWSLSRETAEMLADKILKTFDSTNTRPILSFIDNIELLHPYNVQGHPETYNQYNEAWRDALDHVRIFIKSLGGVN